MSVVQSKWYEVAIIICRAKRWLNALARILLLKQPLEIVIAFLFLWRFRFISFFPWNQEEDGMMHNHDHSWHPQIFVDQLTLSQPGGWQIMPTK